MSSFDRFRDDALYKLAATKILNRLRELRQQGSSADARRWPWELLQNAKDAADGRPLTVSYAADSSPEAPSMIFQHSAGPFELEHLYFLVHQISSKDEPQPDDEPDTTGRFGTGFLTTHLLSRTVQVDGLVKGPGGPVPFRLALDRSGNTADELIAGMRRAMEDLEQAVGAPASSSQPPATPTSFVYPLGTEASRVVAQDGIEDLEACAPLTLAFNSGIESIRLVTEGVTYRTSQRLDLGTGLESVTVERVTQAEVTSRRFLLASGDQATLAVEVSVDSEAPSLIPLAPTVPRLFCDFPLVGTEAVSFPAAINSPSFSPNPERDGIPLKASEDDPEPARNRAILEEAVATYTRLIRTLSDAAYGELHVLAHVGQAPVLPWLPKDWYESKVAAPIRTALLGLPLVETRDGRLLPLITGRDVTAWLPSHPTQKGRETLRELAGAWLDHKLPKPEHVESWAAAAWAGCPVLKPDSLVVTVSSWKSVAVMAEKVGMTPDNAVRWLDGAVAFLVEHGHVELLGRHSSQRPGLPKTEHKLPVLPNQHGLFRLREDLYVDDELDEVLKDVAAGLGVDVRAELLHPAVHLDARHLKGTRSSRDLATKIETAVKEHVARGERDETVRRTFQKLLLWIDQNDAEAREAFGLWLYENQASLFPPREALDLIRLASRVPELEEENAALKQQLDAQRDIESDAASLRTEIERLKAHVADVERTAESHEEAAARVLGASLTEAWEKIKEALVREGDGAKLSSMKDLQRLLKSNPGLFAHVSASSQEAYMRWIKLVDRAKDAVEAALTAHEDYDCGGWIDDPAFPTIVQGVTRHGREVRLVIRPADGGFVVLYEQLERDVLEDPDSELWVEGGGIGPERFNLGKLVNRLGINRLPLLVRHPRPAVLHLS